MRILLTTDAVGGVWEYSATLAHVLADEGHPTLLAVIGDPSEEQVDRLPEAIALECRSATLEWMRPASTDLPQTAEWLARLARLWRADVIHLNQMAYTGFHRFPAPTLVVVHSDLRSWFAEVLGIPIPPYWDGYEGIVRNGLAAATSVAAPSRYQADLVERHFGVSVDIVIHNGVAPPAEAPSGKGKPLLLSAGRAWDEAKGITVLDQAVARLGDRAPAAHLIGPIRGPDGQQCSPRALTVHGQTSGRGVDEWMSRATIYAAPSLYEPFGLAPVEAALHGCALLLSDVGSFRELWGGCAEFFPRGDANTLAERIDGLAQDPARVQGLAAAARERALDRYTASVFGERYLECYRGLAGRDRTVSGGPAMATGPSRERELPPTRPEPVTGGVRPSG